MQFTLPYNHDLASCYNCYFISQFLGKESPFAERRRWFRDLYNSNKIQLVIFVVIVDVNWQGGTDHKKPVCVHKLLKGYPGNIEHIAKVAVKYFPCVAIASRQVFEGDIILSINGESVQDKDHNKAVRIIIP